MRDAPLFICDKLFFFALPHVCSRQLRMRVFSEVFYVFLVVTIFINVLPALDCHYPEGKVGGGGLFIPWDSKFTIVCIVNYLGSVCVC